MAKATVDKKGWFNCDGNGKCGSSCYNSREDIKRCFNCGDCPSYQRDGLKIKDERGQTTLDSF
jgi:hypothetical protein|tara:strand:+ start:9281 stop:9469 length:189 start_codon:yes stop_codon:yes gene_type:complete